MAADELRDVSARGSLVAIAIALIVIAILTGMAVFRGTDVVSKSPKSKQYQAVFLSNGQVYFGKLSNVGSAYVTLKDVYYIQSANAPQPASPSPQPQLSLVKLGEEIHGPEAEMQISNDQIVFWENLKDNGKVVEAIKNQQK